MGVSGQHHAPVALYPRGKDPRYPLYRRLGGPQSRSGHRGYRKNLCPCRGSNPDHRSSSPYSDTILPELPRLLNYVQITFLKLMDEGFFERHYLSISCVYCHAELDKICYTSWVMTISSFICSGRTLLSRVVSSQT
jgi:hypothetical protein